MELKPPTKPGKNATQKALNAYHSQLRRYHRMLEEWDAKLTKINALLDKRKSLLDEIDELDPHDHPTDTTDELECGCTVEDAKNGCDCPDCDIWRDMEVCRLRSAKDQDKGDEVEFLEGLIKLKDIRES